MLVMPVFAWTFGTVARQISRIGKNLKAALRKFVVPVIVIGAPNRL
jgi:hypothetical protein